MWLLSQHAGFVDLIFKPWSIAMHGQESKLTTLWFYELFRYVQVLSFGYNPKYLYVDIMYL